MNMQKELEHKESIIQNHMVPDINYNNGIVQSFSSFYDRYAGAFYGFIKRTLYQEDVCCEVLHSAFIKMWKFYHLYDDSKESFFSWSMKIIREETNTRKTERVIYELFACRRSNLPVNVSDISANNL